jgi:CRISPR system Cascade subunit CasC
MLIAIHAIQNHSPANLNRDDLGAPKTCYFGGVLRSRISSQCIKRSIRMSDEFRTLCGGIRTRQLAKLIADQVSDESDKKRVQGILDLCGFKQIEQKNKNKPEEDDPENEGKSKMSVYTTRGAVVEMANLLRNADEKTDEDLARDLSSLIGERVAVPDMALSGRMLEPEKLSKEVWKGIDTTVEGALQVAHAISTHMARPEVDYFVAADDIPGDDAGAAYLDEAMYASACFYKYFSINWETLVKNLKGNSELAAHTVGAFIRGVALVNPTGKQHSFAANNPPDGMLVEIRDVPISYANAFARPTVSGERDVISQSIAQLGQYVHDLDTGYGRPQKRFWFSPNLRYPLNTVEDEREIALTETNIKSLDELVGTVISAIGYDWKAVQEVTIDSETGL